jgi:hypothetical protein
MVAGGRRPGHLDAKRIERPAPIHIRPIGLPILELPASGDGLVAGDNLSTLRDVLAIAELRAAERTQPSSPGHVGWGCPGMAAGQ